MIRTNHATNKPNLLRIFNANIPEYFDKNEIHDFEKYLEQKAETYLTIEVDHKIVGGTGYYINETDGSDRITWIFFDPTYAGQRLGRQSVEHCLNLFGTNQSVDKVIVTTSQFAYKFFEKYGFTISRIEKGIGEKA